MQRLGEQKLGREELIERTDRRICGRGNLRHRRRIIAFFEKDPGCRFQQDRDALMAALALRHTGLRFRA
ncbi:hypothetical protein GCM10010520_01210 [Rhizobium viscosum]